jgi:hypothetical protein
MLVPCVTAHFLFVLSDSAGQTAFWLGALSMAAVMVTALGWSLRDRTYFYYAGYVVLVGVMGSADKSLAAAIEATWDHRSGAVTNALHLPYAVLFLLFVSNYFRVKVDFPAWARGRLRLCSGGALGGGGFPAGRKPHQLLADPDCEPG